MTDIRTNPLYRDARTLLMLPYAQRVLNPIGVATTTTGEFALWVAMGLVEFRASVYVNGTNNGTNYWTINLLDGTTAAVLATFNTLASAGSTWLRLSTTTFGAQPAGTVASINVQCVPTLAPGTLFIVPSVAAVIT